MSGIAVSIGPLETQGQGPVEWTVRTAPSAAVDTLRLPGFSACVHTDPDRDCGISRHADTILILDGHLVGRTVSGHALRLAMIEEFLAKGADCVRDWCGSFRAVIHQKGTTWVFNDHVGSRPWFRAVQGDVVHWASSALPLLDALPRRTLDGANVLQFLLAGRFFAGGAPYHELRQMLPGCRHRFGPDGEQAETWFICDIAAEPSTRNGVDLRDEMKRLCDEAVLQCFHAAKAPSLMLSGGYDSRFLLNVLHEHLGQAHGVPTWLWCEDDVDPGSDLAWAKRESARLHADFHHLPAQGSVASCFEEMFDAQSGMTDRIFTHADERIASARMASDLGCRSLLRADECFGPDGGRMASRAHALATVGMPAVDAECVRPWVGRAADAWCEHRQAHLDRLATSADAPDDLRDLLYRIERLPALHAHLHAHRMPWLETSNPFLAPSLLSFVSKLPASLRTDKRLFRECFHHFYPTEGFATKPGTGFRWERLRDPASPVRRLLLERLRTLPPPLERAWFCVNVEDALAREWRNAAETVDALRTLQLGARAVIIGHWLHRWPACH